MAIFSSGDSDRNRPDYDLILQRVTLYYSEAILAEDVGWLRGAGYRIHEFDCRRWKTENDFHDEVAATLQFPDYYGRNLNAFADSVGDVEVSEEGGMVLVFTAVEAFAAREPISIWHIFDILAGVTIGNLIHGHRFFTLAQSNDPQIQFEPVGSVPITWNRREWLNSKRGI